jgi:hypothetical protein
LFGRLKNLAVNFGVQEHAGKIPLPQETLKSKTSNDTGA